jgi:hypothetical protein
MLIFTVRNAVVLALMQVGVIVAGVLATATTSKMMSTWNIATPGGTYAFAGYGEFLFLVPLAWITIALRLRRDPNLSDGAKTTAFLLGIGLLLVLLLAIWITAIRPFLKVCFFTMGG